MISVVCFCWFLLFSVVFAFDMHIYESTHFLKNPNPTPAHTSKTKYDFVYHLNETLDMDILVNNKTDVTATIYVTRRNSEEPQLGDTENFSMTSCTKGPCLTLSRMVLNSKFLSIGMQLKRGSTPFATIIISEGKAIHNNISENLCVKPHKCILVIDLQNEHIEDTPDQPWGWPSSWTTLKKNVYIYVIPSIMVMCVIILVICIRIRKIRCRSSDPEHTLELNTYATTNEVQYAELSFVHGNNQPPKQEEESPYAQIVGELHPKKY